MVIDVHAHIFPDAIAEKASLSISKFYDIPVRQGGSVDALLKLGDEAGIDKFVVHSVATTPVQVGSVLSYTLDAYAGETFSGTVTEIRPIGTARQNATYFDVRITLPAGKTLLPGMNATVTVGE